MVTDTDIQVTPILAMDTQAITTDVTMVMEDTQATPTDVISHKVDTTLLHGAIPGVTHTATEVDALNQSTTAIMITTTSLSTTTAMTMVSLTTTITVANKV